MNYLNYTDAVFNASNSPLDREIFSDCFGVHRMS